jgi:cobalt-zinc-cadmium efflux system membrane fusion protein
LQALGVNVRSITADVRQVALIPIRAPLSGIVTERLIAAGSGVQAGQQMFTISNISSLWITASVPEQQLGQVNMGTTAEVKTASLGDEKLYARVTYIDPTLNEDTRTARVRLAVDNPGERLRSGMFVNVGFQTTTSSATGRELVVKTEAIQTVEGKTLVFIPKDDEPGAFEIREIEIGGEVGEYTRVTSGLEIGDKVVTKGSFTLKTAMQKGEMGEHGH